MAAVFRFLGSVAAVVSAALAFCDGASAQSYPTRQVRS